MPLIPAVPKFDPVHDVLHYESQALDSIFAPKTVALIGATENPGSVGRTVLWNLISNPFGGTVFTVRSTSWLKLMRMSQLSARYWGRYA